MISKYEKTNGVKLFALVAVLAMVFAGAAVMLSDSGVDAANEPTRLSGAITATQNFGDGTEVVVDGELTIPAGMALVISGSGKLTVNTGATIEIAAGGQLIFQQVDGKNPTVTINGNITAQGTINPTTYTAADPDNIAYYGAIVNNTVYDATAKTGVTLNGNITLERGAEMVSVASQDAVKSTEPEQEIGTNVVVIPVLSTFSFTGNGDVVLGANASIDVTQRSRSVSVIGGQDLSLNAGAVVNINGNISGTLNIAAVGTGTYYTAGAVSLTDNSVDAVPELTFTVTTQSTPARLTSNADSTVTLRQYIVNAEGTLDGANLATTAGQIVGNTEFFQGSGFKYNLFPTTSITGTLTVKDSGNTLTVADDTTVLVSGTVAFDFNKDATAHSKATINGSIIVTGTMSGSLTTGFLRVSQNDMQDRFVVDGGTVALTDKTESSSGLMNVLLALNNAHLYGSVYTVDGGTNGDDVAYITDFDVAVNNAVAAESDFVYVYAYGTQNKSYTTAEQAADRGAFVVDTDITIPEGLEVMIQNSLVISEGATMTVEEGADVQIYSSSRDSGPAVLWVDGKVVDYDGIMGEYEGTDLTTTGKGILMYEVKKTTETDTEYYITYTTLPIAISEAQPGEEIQLNGSVTIDSDLTIPADVTVITDAVAAAPALTVKGATLTVNGVLQITDINGATTGAVVLAKNDTQTRDGTIIVNNLIANAIEGTFTGENKVAGAYFNAIIDEDDTVGTNYVGSVAIAAENSVNVTAGNNITILGNVSMGDLTFTAGENNESLKVIIGQNANVTAGTVTLVGADFDTMTTGSSFTGNVASDVTAGNTSVALSRASGILISLDSKDDGENVTTTMIINGTLKGTATIQSGSVDAGNALVVGTYIEANRQNNVPEDKAVLTIASGATLNVADRANLSIVAAEGAEKSYAGLVVDGTLAVSKGGVFTISSGTNGTSVDGQMVVAGTATFSGVSDVALGGTVYVTGTLAASTETGFEASLLVSKMYVGDADGAAGTVTGAVNLNTTGGFVVAYTTADVSGAAIDETNGQSYAYVTAYYINGQAYMTSYANANVNISTILSEKIEMTGYEDIVLTDNATTTSWYTDEAMTQALTTSNAGAITGYTAVYAKADLLNAAVRLSIGPGMSVYIDDVRYTSGVLSLAVGEHSIVIQVNPGYSGTTSVTLGGTAITGGTFTITPEIAEEYQYVNEDSDAITLSVMGDIAYDTGSSDDGMGLTEILLVILVILIVVMAIMVALRLMRS